MSIRCSAARRVQVRWLKLRAPSGTIECTISGTSTAGIPKITHDRAALIQQAFRLEYLTLAWMTIEAAVAIGSGIAAVSLTLIAFGIDSLIELASATVLVWRLTVELRYGQTFAENAEQTASRIGGVLLFALAAYAVASASWKI